MEENTAVAERDTAGEAAVTEIPPVKKKRRINRQKLQDNLWGWAFCIPLIVGTVLFVYVALVMAVILSFGNYNTQSGVSIWTYIGQMFSGTAKPYNSDPFYWYKYVFCENQWGSGGPGSWASQHGEHILWSGLPNATGDPVQGTTMNAAGATLFNTVFYMIGIPIGMVLAMFFAVCMSRDIKGGNVFRVLYYIPCVASTISIIYTFKLLFATNGLINKMFGSDLPWLMKDVSGGFTEWKGNGTVDPYWTQGIISKLVIVIMSVWKGLGGTIILYVAGLSGVNAATKEAAQIDGANGWRIFWQVTMPDLYPVIFYNIVTAVIGGMQIYAEPELFFGTGSSVNMMTSGYVSLIWYHGLKKANSNTSLGAAYGMVLAVIIFVLTLFQFWLDSRNKD